MKKFHQQLIIIGSVKITEHLQDENYGNILIMIGLKLRLEM